MQRQNTATRYYAKQVLWLLIAAAAMIWLALGIRAGLAKNGIGFDLKFLSSVANFEVSEGTFPTSEGMRAFRSSDTNGDALIVGFLNTIKTSIIGIVLSTALGVLIGIALISKNWLIQKLSFTLVEFIRNTPLLIQLVFWYYAVALKMPAISEAPKVMGMLLFSQQGIHLPWLSKVNDTSYLSIITLLAAIFFLAIALFKKPSRLWTLPVGFVALTATIIIGFPFGFSVPQIDGEVVTGGMDLSPEFSALFVGLSVYTSAFIAEIVRGAINALPKGQWEAAAALGLTRRSTFKDIIIPQVFRVILPAFGNQYISLAKSTSLGIAIGYSDLFNVSGTVANQSGRSLESILIVMLAFLLLSWTISVLVNGLNARLLKSGGAR